MLDAGFYDMFIKPFEEARSESGSFFHPIYELTVQHDNDLIEDNDLKVKLPGISEGVQLALG